jgi:hypothetical protein
MKKVFIILAALMMVLPVIAQVNMINPALFSNDTETISLLNPNRLNMSHSMGIMAGTSSVGYGYYLSRYTNHLSYAFSQKLKMELDLNVINYGSTASSFKLNDDNNTRIVPDFRLSYQPSDKMHFQIEFHQGNYFPNYYNNWYDRW